MSKKVLFALSFCILLVFFIYEYINYNGTQVTVSSNGAKKNDITIRVMSDLPDRTKGQGEIEDYLAQEYMKHKKNVKIEFETLEDVAYQQKFKAYMASDDLPDIFTTWHGSPDDYLSKIAMELNAKDFAEDGFITGVMESRMRNGKLYGIPRNNDFYLLYYNKSIFAQNNVKVPTTFNELIDAAKKFRNKGIIPCATNGKEKYELSGLYDEIYYKVNPDPLKHNEDWNTASYENDEYQLKAAAYYKRLMDSGFFQDGFPTTEYSAAKNIFTSGRAAMYYMGTWELSMGADSSLDDGFRMNLCAMNIPNIEGERNDIKVLDNWDGGGYSISVNSKVKKQAVDFMKYFFLPSNWARLVWKKGACIAPQHLRLYGNESELMKSVYNILITTDKFRGQYPVVNSAGSFSSGGADSVVQKFSLGLSTPMEFLRDMDSGLKNGFLEVKN